eukprot:CAMPEP_0179946962 /NCGR_PEP_ID=MMETSP0983-20121128/20694_1 /TAXON_ID=483367 /ORGANISM="non described non described, Strain CCMP 2436" /LENGTH=49 /DNA_ID= /DNA_START= /DNA_END= /DNA_ORIENTATION=
MMEEAPASQRAVADEEFSTQPMRLADGVDIRARVLVNGRGLDVLHRSSP